MTSVLVVDDIEVNRYYLEQLLRAHGFEVVAAKHGAEALEQCRVSPPDIIISDLLMPVMDGYTLLRECRADPALAAIPFIVYTATYTEPEDERLAQSLGADAFILKPCEPEDFLLRLRQVEGLGSRVVRTLYRPRASDAAIFQRYSQTLIRKLGEKTLQLEAANEALQLEIRERQRLSELQTSILNALPAHIALIDSNGVIVAVNDSWKRFAMANEFRDSGFGIGQNYLTICDSVQGPCSAEAVQIASGIRDVLAGRAQDFVLEYPCHSPTEQRWFRLMVTLERERHANGAVIMHIDTTQRVLAELQLRESQENYLLLLNSTAEGIFGLDKGGVFTFCNAAGARMLGYASADDVLGVHFHTRHHCRSVDGTPLPLSACPITSVFGSARGTHSIADAFVRTDDTSFAVEYWSYPIVRENSVVGSVTAFFDISARQAIEAQLMQSQKMEAVGQLTGGVAHDFNNLLTVLSGYTQILIDRFHDEPDVMVMLNTMQMAGARAASLTAQLLAFSRKQVMQPKLLSINSLIEETRPMLERLIREDVELEWDLGEVDGVVDIDVARFEQALINIAINARDAMPEGGRVTIATSQVGLDESDCYNLVELQPGPYAVVTISDTGIGMTAETMKRIFDPFFTTKPPGVGTGLGLSTAYGVVKQSRGHIVVSSRLGVGSQFQIYLPIVAAVELPSVPVEVATNDLHGVETVLLVEDDPGLRQYTSEVLRQLGYQVLEAANGVEAIEHAELHQGPIHLLLTDVVMPLMNGRLVATALTERRPGIKTIFMSGYSEDLTMSNGLLEQGLSLLAKPFSPSELGQKVRSMFSGGRHRKTVLVLDDEEAVRVLLIRTLEEVGCTVIGCGDGHSGFKVLQAQSIDLLITDLVMEDQEGIETIVRVRREFPNIRIMAVSGHDEDYLNMAHVLGADVVLRKPIDLRVLREKVQELIGL